MAATEHHVEQVQLLVDVLAFSGQESRFALKATEPDWALFAHPRIAELPAVQWKLRNLLSMKTSQRLAAQARLHAVLETYGR